MTDLEAGEIVPPAPAEAVTVYVLTANVAETVQAPVIAPVVYVVPDNEPPQPVAEAVYPAFGVTVKVVLEP